MAHVICKVCLLKLVFEIYCLQKLITHRHRHRDRQTDTTEYIISRHLKTGGW